MTRKANDPQLNDDNRLGADVVLVLTVLVITAFVMMVNETSLSVALPTIMADFAVTAATAQWLLTGVLLTMAVIMPATGWIIDRFTTRQVFFFAIIMFLLGTVVAAISPTFGIMLLARVFQAVGTAVIIPLMMTVAMTVVPPARRGAIMGIIAVVMAVGPALGPTYAGLVLSNFDWHMIFWLLVPLIVVAGALGAWKMHNIGELKPTPFDVLSLILSAFAFGGLVYGLSSIGIIVEGGRAANIALGVTAVGIIALAFFVWRQLRLAKAGKALLDLRPLANRNFTFAVIILLTGQAALLGVVNTLPLYLQGALLTGALIAGVVNLPGGLLETVMAPVAGNLFDRVGARPLIIPGAVITAGSLFFLAFITTDSTPVWLIVVFYAVLSLGISFLFSPLMTTALGSLSSSLYSHGSAILNTLLQLVGAAGTAVMIAIYSYFSQAGDQSPAAQAEGAAMAFLVSGCVALVGVLFTFFVRDTRRDKTAKVVAVAEPQ